MELRETDKGLYGISTGYDQRIRDSQSILDLIADLNYSGCSDFILYKEDFSEDFFDLKTGVAGDILQKMANYRIRIAIIGDFSGYTSNSLRAFIRECNRGNQTFFVADEEQALLKLTGEYMGKTIDVATGNTLFLTGKQLAGQIDIEEDVTFRGLTAEAKVKYPTAKAGGL